MSIASLRDECARLHALAVLGGKGSPPWLVGGGTDLIHWNGPGFTSDPLDNVAPGATELITKHLEPYAGLRVHRKFLPEWIVRSFGDASQVDGRSCFMECDGPLVKLRSHGLFPPRARSSRAFQSQDPGTYMGFSLGAQTFLVGVAHGEILDAT